MTREMIITELNNRGYNAEAQNTIKNGVELEGIRILTDSNISPIIYTEKLIETAEKENMSMDEILSIIIDIYESNKSFKFDVNILLDRNFILHSIFIGLQKVSTEDIVKKLCEDFDGIESYLYIRGEENQEGDYYIKVSKSMLDRANISLDEAWTYAQTNTEAETTIDSMAMLLCEFGNMEYSEEMEDDDIPKVFFISNESKCKGASSILNKKALSVFGDRYHTNKVVVIPSSIHEMLLIPYTEEISLDRVSDMVREVNSSVVDPMEQLSDRAFILTI